MKYDIDWVKEKFDTEQRLKYLFFWGHRPNKDGSIGKGCLSQWWEQPFSKEALTFQTAEHWMMYKKACLFKDQAIAEKILVAKNPAVAKKLGRQVPNFKQDIWEKHRFSIVLEGNILKFSQNPPLAEFLIKTGERVLVEASPVDAIWGIQLAKDAPTIENPNTWKGLNLLGFALMEVRDLLMMNEK